MNRICGRRSFEFCKQTVTILTLIGAEQRARIRRVVAERVERNHYRAGDLQG